MIKNMELNYDANKTVDNEQKGGVILSSYSGCFRFFVATVGIACINLTSVNKNCCIDKWMPGRDTGLSGWDSQQKTMLTFQLHSKY